MNILTQSFILGIVGVADCCVVGVFDQKGNDIIYAFVVKNINYEINEEQILTIVNGKFKINLENY